jgi:hypothetical protein
VTDTNRPVLGEPDAPCRTCRAPLATDQRYCLQCGTRRAEARLPFLEILARQVPASPAATTTVTRQTGPAGWLGRVSTNAAAVAGVACLLLALGVGVLIGGIGSGDSAASAGPPQVITVGGAAPAAAPAATSSAPAATETTPEETTTTEKKKSSKKSSSSAGAKSTSSAVKDLDKTSGSDYAKKAEKLPKTLGTGGAPPPKDTSGKAIGGGSDTEEIG